MQLFALLNTLIWYLPRAEDATFRKVNGQPKAVYYLTLVSLEF